MDESDHAQCVSELTSKKVVFDQPIEATREGCRLSAPVSLTLVATEFGDVSLPAKPSMLCSFGLKFTDWVRDVAAPLTFAYTGQIELRAARCLSSSRAVIMKPFVIALSVLVVAAPSFAIAASDADGYPPGLFEHSPLIDPSHPAKQASASVAAHRFPEPAHDRPHGRHVEHSGDVDPLVLVIEEGRGKPVARQLGPSRLDP